MAVSSNKEQLTVKIDVSQQISELKSQRKSRSETGLFKTKRGTAAQSARAGKLSQLEQRAAKGALTPSELKDFKTVFKGLTDQRKKWASGLVFLSSTTKRFQTRYENSRKKYEAANNKLTAQKEALNRSASNIKNLRSKGGLSIYKRGDDGKPRGNELTRVETRAEAYHQDPNSLVFLNKNGREVNNKTSRAIGAELENYSSTSQSIEKLTVSVKELGAAAAKASERAQTAYQKDAKKQAGAPNANRAAINQVETSGIETINKSQQSFNDEQIARQGQLEVTNLKLQKQRSSLGKSLKAFSLYAAAIRVARAALREAVTTVTELDKSLTEQAMVTGLTRKTAYELLGTYQELAGQLGATTKEVAESVSEYLKQGKSVSDSLTLTEAAISAAKVAGISTADSIDYLTTALNGFRLSADEARLVSDKFAAVAAASATDYDELAIALSKVASQANLAGRSIDYTTALLTTGLEVTREAPETMGTALKTIIARRREISDYGETLEDGVDLNNVETQLGYVGIALRNSNGELRSTEDVLDDLGRKWNTLTTNQQAAIAKALAGTRQQSRLIAMMDNYERVIELQERSADSAGATEAQRAEYLGGLEASRTRLQNAWQKFTSSLVNSDVVINLINSATWVLNHLASGLETMEGQIAVWTTLSLIGVNILSGLEARRQTNKEILKLRQQQREVELQMAKETAENNIKVLEQRKAEAAAKGDSAELTSINQQLDVEKSKQSVASSELDNLKAKSGGSSGGLLSVGTMLLTLIKGSGGKGSTSGDALEAGIKNTQDRSDALVNRWDDKRAKWNKKKAKRQQKIDARAETDPEKAQERQEKLDREDQQKQAHYTKKQNNWKKHFEKKENKKSKKSEQAKSTEETEDRKKAEKDLQKQLEENSSTQKDLNEDVKDGTQITADNKDAVKEQSQANKENAQTKENVGQETNKESVKEVTNTGATQANTLSRGQQTVGIFKGIAAKKASQIQTKLENIGIGTNTARIVANWMARLWLLAVIIAVTAAVAAGITWLVKSIVVWAQYSGSAEQAADKINELGAEIYKLNEQNKSIEKATKLWEDYNNAIFKTAESLEAVNSAWEEYSQTIEDDEERELFNSLDNKGKYEYAQRNYKQNQEAIRQKGEEQASWYTGLSASEQKKFWANTDSDSIQARSNLRQSANIKFEDALEQYGAGLSDESKSQVKDLASAIISNMEEGTVDLITSESARQQLFDAIANTETASGRKAVSVLNDAEATTEEKVAAFETRKAKLIELYGAESDELKAFTENFSEYDFYAQLDKSALKFIDTMQLSSEELQKLQDNLGLAKDEMIDFLNTWSTQGLDTAMTKIFPELEKGSVEWAQKAEQIKKSRSLSAQNSAQSIDALKNDIDSVYETAAKWNSRTENEKISFKSQYADIWDEEMEHAFQTGDFATIKQKIASSEAFQVQRDQALKEIDAQIELEKEKGDLADQNLIRSLEQQKAYLSDADSLYEASLEDRRTQEENYLDTYKDYLKAQEEALTDSLSKRKEAYQSYFDAINETAEDEDYLEQSNQLIANLSKLGSTTDAATNSRRQDLETQLQELEEERQDTLRQRAQDAIISNIEDQIDDISDKFDDLLDNNSEMLKLRKASSFSERFASAASVQNGGNTALDWESWLQSFVANMGSRYGDIDMSKIKFVKDNNNNLYLNVNGQNVLLDTSSQQTLYNTIMGALRNMGIM